MIYNVYGLVSPIDGQVVYVGMTTHSIEHRLKQHYWHLNEVNRGERKTNKRFEYLKSILPLKVTIKLLTSFNTDNKFSLSPKYYENFYIKKYRELNPNLLNETDGGIGENTYKYKSENDIKEIGNKISNKLKGKSKPEGFAENLSKIRKGSNNPNAKGLEHPIYIVDCNTQKRLKGFFAYSYQIDNFLCKKNAWSNIKKAINHINMRNGSRHRYQVCYGYYWLTWDCAKDYPLE